MVLFIYIPLWFYLYSSSLRRARTFCWFTFHYGSTYTGFAGVNSAIANLFTFHYGSTYTRNMSKNVYITYKFTFHYGSTYTPATHSMILYLYIYIPLWFYLYGQYPSLSKYIHVFTFHYGSTYTLLMRMSTRAWQNLHSTMVLLILRKAAYPPILSPDLHSTMVLLIRKERVWLRCCQ